MPQKNIYGGIASDRFTYGDKAGPYKHDQIAVEEMREGKNKPANIIRSRAATGKSLSDPLFKGTAFCALAQGANTGVS